MFKVLKEKILSTLTNDETSDKKSDFLMGALSFAESSFFPIPPDFFIFPLVVKKPTRWFRLAMIVSATSVLGGLFGYLIGFSLFETIGRPIVAFYNLESEMAKIGEIFYENDFLAIFLSALTPIPYKVFTIAAGLFHTNLWHFILASIIGRSARFFAVAYAGKFFGEKYGNLIVKYFNWMTAIIGAGVIIFLIFQFT